METSSPGNHSAHFGTARKAVVAGVFAGLMAMLLCVGGCGAPGEPVPPSPPIPAAITDLTAHQAGDGALLEFTMPGKTIAGEKLTAAPTMEILRGSLGADGSADAKSFRVVDTIPGALMSNYIEKGRVRFLDPIAPEEIRAHTGATVVYRVRARVTGKKTSADSNDAALKLIEVAAPIEKLDAQLTENGIELRWVAPERASGGGPIAALEAYHLYRGELEAGAAETATKDMSHVVWKAPLLQIAKTKTPDYRDAGFDYGKTYVYIVRSVLTGDAPGVESGDSRAAILKPVDTFPPAAPQGVVAAVLPGVSANAFVVDLSWSINVEADLAGYHVYRSDTQGTAGQLLNKELLPTPAYRDDAAMGGRSYWYSVTAVDRAGNESKASESTAVEVGGVTP